MSLELALELAAILAGACGVLFGLRCYSELRKWARQCQGARLAIANKGRVQLDAPLLEVLEWANALERDEASRGRVFYRNGRVSVAVLKPADRPRVEISKPSRFRRRRSSSSTAAAA